MQEVRAHAHHVHHGPSSTRLRNSHTGGLSRTSDFGGQKELTGLGPGVRGSLHRVLNHFYLSFQIYKMDTIIISYHRVVVGS